MKKSRDLELQKAIFLIQGILEEYDASGMVVLHRPGSTETLARIDPSWSCAKQEGDRIKIRAKIEDFKGDTEAREKVLKDTADMFRRLTGELITTGYPFHEISEKLDLKLEELFKPKT